MFTNNVGDVQSTADAIHAALTLPAAQRESNWEKLFAVSGFSPQHAVHWLTFAVCQQVHCRSMGSVFRQ